MKLVWLVIPIILIGFMGISESFAESVDWKYDGATSSCEGIKGKIIYDENSQPKECQYGELLFQIINIQEACGAAITTWTDPFTKKQFEFTTTCGHPVICKSTGDIEFGHSGRTTNYSHYVKSTFLDVMGLDKKGFVTVEPSGKICYFDAPIYYDDEKNILTIDVDGIWEQVTLTVEIPPELHTDDIQVLVNETPIRFSIEEQFIEPSIVRDRSVITFDLEQSSEKQLIKILPKIKESFAESISNEKQPSDTSIDDLNTKYLLSPKKQISIGVYPTDIICKDGLELIFKSSDDSPVCVKPETAKKLVERGWAEK